MGAKARSQLPQNAEITLSGVNCFPDAAFPITFCMLYVSIEKENHAPHLIYTTTASLTPLTPLTGWLASTDAAVALAFFVKPFRILRTLSTITASMPSCTCCCVKSIAALILEEVAYLPVLFRGCCSVIRSWHKPSHFPLQPSLTSGCCRRAQPR